MEEYVQDISSGTGEFRRYFRKLSDGETIEHFAIASQPSENIRSLFSSFEEKTEKDKNATGKATQTKTITKVMTILCCIFTFVSGCSESGNCIYHPLLLP